MLKDILGKFIKEKEVNKDEIKNNFIDGFIDIKAFRDNELVYHEAGDNAVTDWMRQAILLLLTGDSFSTMGSTNTSGEINTINTANHTVNTINDDGYLLNKEQYFWNPANYTGHYSISDSGIENIYSLFPTKVLFGTGKEYASWNDLKNDTLNNYPEYYTNMLEKYGPSEAEAIINFNAEIASTLNTYSSTLDNGTFIGSSATKVKTRTVPNPNSDKNTNPSPTLNSEYGITGAIKTTYHNIATDAAKLDSNKELTSYWSGVGKPAFIYLNTPAKAANIRPKNWDNTDPTVGSEVTVTRDTSKNYLEKITFTITLPEQSGSNDSIGLYYPYNGFVLKQIGLFCDSRFSYTSTSNVNSSVQYNNMASGIMLAKKEISPITKTADLKIQLSWILSI